MLKINIVLGVLLLLCGVVNADTVVGKGAEMINSPIETFGEAHAVTSRGQLASDAKTEESSGKLIIKSKIEYFEVTNSDKMDHLKYTDIKAIKLIIDAKPWQDALASKLSGQKIAEIKASGDLEIEGDSKKTTEKVSCNYTRGSWVKVANTDYLIECRSKKDPSFDHFEVTLRYANVPKS